MIKLVETQIKARLQSRVTGMRGDKQQNGMLSYELTLSLNWKLDESLID